MTDTWQPGIPLHPLSRNGGGEYRTNLYNFRDDPRTDFCACSDAASWPEPGHWRIVSGDELGAFITAHRLEREAS